MKKQNKMTDYIAKVTLTLVVIRNYFLLQTLHGGGMIFFLFIRHQGDINY
jgi:hypothetical protein